MSAVYSNKKDCDLPVPLNSEISYNISFVCLIFIHLKNLTYAVPCLQFLDISILKLENMGPLGKPRHK